MKHKKWVTKITKCTYPLFNDLKVPPKSFTKLGIHEKISFYLLFYLNHQQWLQQSNRNSSTLPVLYSYKYTVNYQIPNKLNQPCTYHFNNIHHPQSQSTNQIRSQYQKQSIRYHGTSNLESIRNNNLNHQHTDLIFPQTKYTSHKHQITVHNKSTNQYNYIIQYKNITSLNSHYLIHIKYRHVNNSSALTFIVLWKYIDDKKRSS